MIIDWAASGFLLISGGIVCFLFLFISTFKKFRNLEKNEMENNKKYCLVVQSTAATTLLGGSPAVSLSSSATKSSTNPHSTLSLSHPLVLERGGVGGMRSGFVRYEDEDDDEFSSNDDGGSDSDQTAGLGGVRAGGGAGVGGVSGVVGSGVDRRPARMNKAMMQNRGKILPSNARQRNLKQKFVALLKRFKITEDLQGLENEADEDPTKLTGTLINIFLYF
jgi:hypothetical protein